MEGERHRKKSIEIKKSEREREGKGKVSQEGRRWKEKQGRIKDIKTERRGSVRNTQKTEGAGKKRDENIYKKEWRERYKEHTQGNWRG